MDKTPNRPKRFLGKRSLVIIIAVIAALLILGVGLTAGNSPSKKGVNAASLNTSTDTRTQVLPPKSTANINRTFTFDIKDNTGKSLGKIDYTLDNGEVRDEIVVKGEKATAVKGKTFLIINLKLKNSQNDPITLNTRDFVRLSVNNTKDWLAPDIYNDPVEVQAISTKISRLGFAINDTDKNIKLQVGEVDGTKTIVELKI
ncbi:MAG: hypothetical protein M1426_01755 [Patescibacteria group bacterium]|nr:hypothetical protein [Patescibacteria group bacterium]